MCGLFKSIFEANELGLASMLVVLGEIFYMIVFSLFNTAELRETFDEILNDTGAGGDDLYLSDWERTR